MTTGTIHSLPTSRLSSSTNADTAIGIVSNWCRWCASARNRYGRHENSPWRIPTTATADAPVTSIAATETLLVEPLAASRSIRQLAEVSPYSAKAGEFAERPLFGEYASHDREPHARLSSSGFSDVVSDTLTGYYQHHLSKRSDQSEAVLGFEQPTNSDFSFAKNSSTSNSGMSMLFPWSYYFANQFPALFHERPSVAPLDPIIEITDEVWPYQNLKNSAVLYNEIGSGEALGNETTIVDAVIGDYGAWQLNFYMHGVVMPIIAFFGILANAASFIVLTRRAMRSAVINTYLAALSAFDGLLLLIAFLLYPPMSYCEWYGSDATSGWCRYFFHSSLITYPLSLIAQSGSVWTLVAITIDRYIAITWPLASRKWTTNRRALLVVGITVLWSIIYNIPAFLELKLIQQPIEFDQNGQPVSYVTLLDRTDLRKDGTYVRAYKGYCYLIFMLLLPAGTMIALNAYVTVSVRKASRDRRQNMNASGREDKERRCTVMAVLVVGTFLILNLLAFVNNMLEGFRTEDELATTNFLTLVCFGNVLVALNSATNFIIYYALGLRFRQMFCKLFCPCCYTPEREYQYLSVYYGSGRNYCWTNGGGAGRDTSGNGDPASSLLGGGIISMRTLSATKPPHRSSDRASGQQFVKARISAPKSATNRSPVSDVGQRNVSALSSPGGARISAPVEATNARLHPSRNSPQNVVRIDVSQRN